MAFAANLLGVAAKLAAGLITGSAALLAEAAPQEAILAAKVHPDSHLSARQLAGAMDELD